MKTNVTAPALFLDRDGTLIHRYHYPSRPEHLRLYEGIATPLATLQRAGFRLVIVTNQSGIARGYFTEADLERMHAYLRSELAQHGISIDAIYHCPHHPDGVVAGLAIRCACRKPAPGMPLRAAQELGLDLARSWFMGDILDDIEAGVRAGCRTVLVDLQSESAPRHPLRAPDFVARDTAHALEIILGVERMGPLPDLSYRPERWLHTTETATDAVRQGRIVSSTARGGPHEQRR